MILHRRIGALNPVCFFLGNTFQGVYMTIARLSPVVFHPFSEKSRYLETLRLCDIHFRSRMVIWTIDAMINFPPLCPHCTRCFTSDKWLFLLYLNSIQDNTSSKENTYTFCLFYYYSQATFTFFIFDNLHLLVVMLIFFCNLFSLVQHWRLWRYYLSPRRSWCCFH